jgi:hypothetical protein
MRYRLEHRIHTLAELTINGAKLGEYAFAVEEVTFSQWPTDAANAWQYPFWLAVAEIEAGDYIMAWQKFRRRLMRIAPRIAVVSQCYLEFLGQPILIVRSDLSLGFVHWVKDEAHGGLCFMESERKAVELLLQNEGLPEQFFYYWNDAINSSGYASKLLLMLGAIETLVNLPTKKGRPKKDYELMEKILGPDLKKALWGEAKKSDHALRHRLAHGLYFDPGDGDTDYVQQVHRRLINFLNDEFGKGLLDDGIIDPQRHPMGSKIQARAFLKPVGAARLQLPDVMIEAVDDIDNLNSYETLLFDDHHKTF